MAVWVASLYSQQGHPRQHWPLFLEAVSQSGAQLRTIKFEIGDTKPKYQRSWPGSVHQDRGQRTAPSSGGFLWQVWLLIQVVFCDNTARERTERNPGCQHPIRNCSKNWQHDTERNVLDDMWHKCFRTFFCCSFVHYAFVRPLCRFS